MRRNIIVCLALISATLAVYGQVSHFEFLNYDDPHYVWDNMEVRRGLSIRSIAWAFTSGHGSNWHPLTWISHMVDCQLFGWQRAGGHHISNVLLHVLNTLLLFGLLKRMTEETWPSAFVAALFALHPLHIESVAWISERKDVLSAMFGLLAIWTYMAYARHGGFARYGQLAMWLTFGLMAKPMLVTLPLVFLLLDYWPLRRTPVVSPTRLLMEKLPLLGLSVGSSIVTLCVQTLGGTVSRFDALPVGERLANVAVSYVRYPLKMIWPSELTVIYPHPNFPGGTAWSTWQITGAVLALVVVSVWALRSGKHVLVGWLWYLGMLVPVIGLVQAGPQAMADRYTYLPLIGLFILITWSVTQALAKWRDQFPVLRSAVWALVIVSLVVCTGRSLTQVGHWRDSLTLFRHAVATAPSPWVYNQLGRVYQEKKELEQAVTQYQLALEMYPQYALALTNMGTLVAEQDQRGQAMDYFRRALQIDKHQFEARFNLAEALHAERKHDEAVAHYLRVLELRPDHAITRNSLGAALLSLGRVAQAIPHLQAALKIDPKYESARKNLEIAKGWQE